MKYRLHNQRLVEMLSQRFWIASRAPSHGFTDRLTFDIDAKSAEQLPARDLRYWQIRELMGSTVIPLVYLTPSGYGLRVVYRVPSTRLEALTTAVGRGSVADALRAAGLDVDKGAIEVFPQVAQAERLPLGKGMPILDPQTLEPVAGLNIGHEFDVAALERCIERIEDWHHAPSPEVLHRIAALPKSGPRTPTPSAQIDKPLVVEMPPPIALPEVNQLLIGGLPHTKLRQHAEASVLRAFLTDPASYPEYGLSESATRRDYASALARWLATHHNNNSDDWRTTVDRVGSDAEAEATFVETYLAKASDGTDFIDRMVRLLGTSPELSLTPEPDDDDFAAILHLGERNYPVGAMRNRFEVWTTQYLRTVKRLVLRNRRLKREVKTQQFGDQRVVIELSSVWMRDWPYGSGRSSDTGAIRYVEFLKALSDADVIRLVTPHRAPTLARKTGQAKRFAVRVPNLSVQHRHLPAPPERIRLAIADLGGYAGQPLGVAEALHALYVRRTVPRADKRYGRASARRLGAIASLLETRLGGKSELAISVGANGVEHREYADPDTYGMKAGEPECP